MPKQPRTREEWQRLYDNADARYYQYRRALELSGSGPMRRSLAASRDVWRKRRYNYARHIKMIDTFADFKAALATFNTDC